MKKQMILLSCALGLSVASARSAEEKDQTPLGKQMEAVSDAYKAFRKETDPVKGAALARDAQQGALKAAMEVPAMVKEMPEGPEKIKAALEYRKMMGKLFASLCDVEEAFNNGKLEDVAKIVNNLKDLKKGGHEKFIKEEK